MSQPTQTVSNGGRPPLALFPAFVAQRPETLMLTGKVIGQDYTITTSSGQALFRVEFKYFSLSHQRFVSDMQGRPLFTIRKETFNFGPAIYYLHAPDNEAQRLCEIHFKITFAGTKAVASFVNPATGRKEELEMEKQAFSRRLQIVHLATGTMVAEIKEAIFSARDRFEAVVSPGVDMALVSALCMVFHDREQEHSS